MKVTVNEDSKANDIKYPCLTIDDDGLIVYMMSRRVGVVIKGDGVYPEGHSSKSWERGTFKPFNGSITLSND